MTTMAPGYAPIPATRLNAAIAAYLAANPAGPQMRGTVTLAQTATVALALGIREVPAALAGATVGARYLAFCDSYRLNGAAAVKGRPAGYVILDVTCRTAGEVIVAVQAPLLAIGNSYALTVSIFEVVG